MQPDTSNKRVAKNTVILYFRMLFQMAVYLYTSRILLQVMGVENYGLYDVVGGMVAVLLFLNNSMTTCTQRYITVALGGGNRDYLNKVYSAATIIHVLLAVVVAVAGGLAGSWYIAHYLVFPMEKLWDVYVVFGCSLLSGMFLIMSVPSNATIVAHEDMGAFAAITIVDVLLKLGAALSLYLFPTRLLLPAYACLMCTEAAVVRLIYWLYVRHHYRTIRFTLVRDGSLYREMLAFMGWSTFGNLSIVANTQGINLLLNAFGGPAANAARAVAFQVQTAVTQFIASFQTAINPQITKSYAGHDLTRCNRLILCSSRLSFMLMLFMAIPLLLETEFVLGLWLGENVPAHAVSFVRLLLCVSMVDCVANPMMVGAAATGKVRGYYLTIGTTLLMTLPIGYWAVSRWEAPECIFIALLCTTLLAQVFRLFICRRLFGFSIRAFLRHVAGRIVLAGAVGMALPVWLHSYWEPASLLAHGGFIVCCLLWTGCTVALTGLERGERQFVLQKTNQLLHRK